MSYTIQPSRKALLLAGPLAYAWPAPAKVERNCGICGEPIHGLRRNAGKTTCAICERPFDLIDYRKCTICRSLFVGRPLDRGHRKTCGATCAAKHRRVLSNTRKRNREHAERARSSDITNAQELAIRARARKCPLCGVYLTSKPGLPNSKHLDHIVPLGVGGTHTHGNVRIICRTCNVRRPRDGSDYTGPLTLWAAVPGVVSR